MTPKSWKNPVKSCEQAGAWPMDILSEIKCLSRDIKYSGHFTGYLEQIMRPRPGSHRECNRL